MCPNCLPDSCFVGGDVLAVQTGSVPIWIWKDPQGRHARNINLFGYGDDAGKGVSMFLNRLLPRVDTHFPVSNFFNFADISNKGIPDFQASSGQPDRYRLDGLPSANDQS